MSKTFWLTLIILCSSFQTLHAAEASSRSFHMGFTPFHFSWIEDKKEETYQMIADHSDLILHHFDEGVPWPEAYDNRPFHKHVQKEIRFRKKHMRPGQEVFVATTPLDFNRKKRAGYWGKKPNMKMPKHWRKKDLDDPKIIQAYIQYCQRLIDEFQPKYFAYGIEVNLMADNNPKGYDRFLELAGEVYPKLKAANPDLPIFVSFYLERPERREEMRKAVEPLLPFTDILAISTYPYMANKGDGYRPDQIPEDWFTYIKTLAPHKPFAVAETGYVAEKFKVFGQGIKANADSQRKYVERLLRDANDLDAEFVVWFVVADYDQLWKVLKWMTGFNPLMRAWKDTGLFDGKLKPRPALQVWDQWLQKPIQDK